MRPLEEDELDLYHLAEDAPQIAGIIDERPDDMRTLEEFRGSRRWKIMSDEYGVEDIKVTAVEYEDKKVVTSLSSSSRIHGKSDLAQERILDSTRESKKTHSKHSASDSSPLRKCEGDSDALPSRKPRIHSDSNVSPPRNLQAQRDLGELPPKKDSRGTGSDSSPPRKCKQSPVSLKRSYSEVSPHRKEKSKVDLSAVGRSKLDRNFSPVRRNNRDGDLSPARKSQHDAELSLIRKYNHESEKPVSAPGKSKYGGSPPRKKYHCDLSPPRKSGMQNDPDTSPPRKSRGSEECDETPLRNSRKHDNKINREQRRCSDSDASPHRKTPRHDLPSVQSRKDNSRAFSSLKTSRNNDSDSPGKSGRYERDGSLPIKSKQGEFKESNKINKDHSVIMQSVSPTRHHDKSQSPHRRDRHRSSPDSPPRKSRVHARSGNSPQRVFKRPRNAVSPSSSAPKRSDYEGRGKVEDKYGHQDTSDKMKGKLEKTLDGKRAGLQAAGELRQEISDSRQREDELFAQVSIAVTI
jgi:pre-mRNA-splicing factor CWC26